MSDTLPQDSLSTAQAMKLGFSRSLPIVLGYAPVAFAFGVLATQQGMPIWLATATSVLMFAGSGQFITISLWFAGAGYISTALAVFVTNLRYVLMAVALAPHVRSLKGLSRFIYGWQITDELFAVHITAFQQGFLYFLHEQALAAHLGQGDVLNLVAAGVDDGELDVEIGFKGQQGVADVIGLPQGQLASACGYDAGTHASDRRWRSVRRSSRRSRSCRRRKSRRPRWQSRSGSSRRS